MHSVIGDIPVNNEASVVTSSSREFAGLVFEYAHRVRVCVHVFIGV